MRDEEKNPEGNDGVKQKKGWKPKRKKPGTPGASSVDALKKYPKAMKVLK